MENTTKTSSCLAITEKKTHKPGGCVGVFFQLFDWNRRSGKKKLFSDKLLPPARAKQGSKKFRADEWMPSSKLHLIADENSGGFPNKKKDSTRNVKFVKQHEMRSPSLVARLMGLESMPIAAKKASFSEASEKGFEKRSTKIDSRPPNLRKSDDSEKKTEAFPFKSVLSRSRKNQLPSPIKSPSFSLGRSAARTSLLIDAAARILEPGLQATSRAKTGIAYSNYQPHASFDNNSDQSCDNLMNFSEFGQNMSGIPSIYAYQSETRPPLSSLKPERDLLFESRRERCIFIDSDKSKINPSVDDQHVVERVHLNHQFRTPSSASQPRKLGKHDSSLPGRDRDSARSKPSNIHSGRVSSSAAHAPGGARARTPIKHENGKFDMARRTPNNREDPLPQSRASVRKRRTAGPSGSIDSQCERSNSKPRNMACSKSTGRRLGFDPCSMNRYSSNESKLVDHEEATMEGGDRRGISYQRKYSVGGGDAIGALLEQKLKELSSHEEDESTASFPAKRSTAIILQELIAALTADPPRSCHASAKAAETEMSATTSKNVNQSSPGSVLEASFSSGSLDDEMGSRLHMQAEAELSVSASSMNKIGSSLMLSDISSMLQTMNLSGSKLSHAEEVLLHVQLLFGNLTQHFINESIDSLLTMPFFVEELRNISDRGASEKEGITKMGFVFDGLIEFLDSKYSQFCKFGFDAWTRLPASLNPRKLARDVEDEVKKWKSFSQMSLDEMIEREMSRSLEKWTEFGSEGFETGAAIQHDILQDLVGEIVIDLLEKTESVH